VGKLDKFKEKLFNRYSRRVVIVFPILLLGVFIYLMTMNNVYLKSYEIEKFDRASETIRSPITVENEVETDRKMRETVLSIEDRYSITEEITEERIKYIEELFDATDKLTKENEEIVDDKENGSEPLSNDELVFNLSEILSDEIVESVNDVMLAQLVSLNPDERLKGKNQFIKSVEKILDRGVRIENINSAKEEVNASIKYSSLDEQVKDILFKLIDFAVVENSFYDAEKTIEARNDAASSVTPVVISSGDILVQEGQIITNEIYSDLELVGLLKQQKRIFPELGLVLFILLLLFILMNELFRLHKRNQFDFGKMIIFVSSIMIVTVLLKIISLFSDQLNHLYLIVPVATVVLLIKFLINERLSIVVAIVLSIIGSIIFNGEIPGSLNFEAGIYFLFVQFAAIILLRNIQDRISIIKISFGMMLINVMIIVIFLLLSFIQFELISAALYSGYGIVGAILSGVLAIGLLPFFETGLGILSDQRLLTLANPNQPLLKKLLTEAPGTYHHSVMVANLSETACEAIGANGLLARVGAYYHDIGKTVNPHYFIENQVAIRNPHDFIEPEQSATIIINHVIDGVKLLKEHKLPKEIIDIAAQHHGTSMVEFFYHKAKQENEDVMEEDFRYPGPIPTSKEAGIISICDSVEAAVRSLKEPSTEKIEEIVTSIINKRLTDGQFNHTPLTIGELHNIKESVCDALNGIFHSRIQYPSEEERN